MKLADQSIKSVFSGALKVIITLCFLFFLSFNQVLADNTYSIDLERTSSQYLDVDSDLGVSFTGNITVEAWVRPEVSDGYNKTVFGLADADTDVSYDIHFDDGGVSCSRIRNGVGVTSSTWSTNLPANEWIHLVCTYDGSDLRLYSAPAAGSHTLRAGPTAASGSGSSALSDNFAIGHETTATWVDFDGMIDDVRVWSSVKSAANLDDEFEQEQCGDESNLLGYWKLNNDLLDETSSGNDLTNNNSAVFDATVPFVTTKDCGEEPPAGGSTASTTYATTTEGILTTGFVALIFGQALMIFMISLFVTGYLYNNLIKPGYER